MVDQRASLVPSPPPQRAWAQELDDASNLLTTFTDILCQIVCMSREHIVGSVHRRGQQSAVFATLVGLVKRFEVY